MARRANSISHLCHRFNRELRLIDASLSRDDFWKSLIAERKLIMKNLLKSMGATFVLALWLLQYNMSLQIKLPIVEISIDRAFLALIASACLTSLFIAIINYYLYTALLHRAAKTFYGSRDPSSFLLIFDSNDAWGETLVGISFFFLNWRRWIAISLFGAIFLFGTFLVLLLVVYFTLFKFAIVEIFANSIVSAKGMSGILSLGLLIFALTSTLYAFYPFRLYKNIDYVRWNFLAPIHLRTGFIPPHALKWQRAVKSTDRSSK